MTRVRVITRSRVTTRFLLDASGDKFGSVKIFELSFLLFLSFFFFFLLTFLLMSVFEEQLDARVPWKSVSLERNC